MRQKRTEHFDGETYFETLVLKTEKQV